MSTSTSTPPMNNVPYKEEETYDAATTPPSCIKTTDMSRVQHEKPLGKGRELTRRKKLEKLVFEVTEIAVAALKESGYVSAYEGVELFFREGPKKYGIDDCVRWHLLLKVVNLDVGDADDAEARINPSKMLLQQKPFLAFENPYVSESARSGIYWQQCTNAKMHRSHKDPNTPFYVAASSGNSRVIRAMILNGRNFYNIRQAVDEQLGRQEFLTHDGKILQQFEPGKLGGESTLMLAANANEGSVATLGELLRVGGIVLSEDGQRNMDRTFEYAIKQGMLPVVEMILDYPQLIDIFVTSDNIILALDGLAPKKPETFNRKVVGRIITLGQTEIWLDKLETVLTEKLNGCLLHLAVWHQKQDFVMMFLDRYPRSMMWKEAIEDGGEENYPLWYNNRVWKASKPEGKDLQATMKIRAVLVERMVHQVSDMGSLSNMFYSCNDKFTVFQRHKYIEILTVSKVGELCFDLSRINSVNYKLSDLIDSFIRQSRGQKRLPYERTILYAEFSQLDGMVAEREHITEGSHFKRQHNEVFRILNWLKARKGLKVPDRLVNLHDELRMAHMIEVFRVENLNWKVLDFPICVLEPGTKDGNRAVISHWFSSKGIPSLRNAFRDARKRENVSNLPKIGKAEPVPWYPTQELANLTEAFGVSSVAARTARVAEDITGITFKRVAQVCSTLHSILVDLPNTYRTMTNRNILFVKRAIEWARSKEVDVISMSFIFEDVGSQVSKHTEKATDDSIVMTCSAHDEGSRIETAYPASYRTVGKFLITLAACDKFGKTLRESHGIIHDYLIKSEPNADPRQQICGLSCGLNCGLGKFGHLSRESRAASNWRNNPNGRFR
ncbi:hypothetical protein RRF57_006721 [Xylaria bambusicola]|uniref:Peptidase S8/S53 domain-containing protein n=1 Tax=Xylaria bambusicola TaxID=326684 RepID=A0AAN7UQR0_9PEZI